MPVLAGVGEADVLAVPALVRDPQDLGVIRQQELIEDVNGQATETAAEGDVLFGRDVLVAKENERVIEECLVYRAEGRVVHRPGTGRCPESPHPGHRITGASAMSMVSRNAIGGTPILRGSNCGVSQ